LSVGVPSRHVTATCADDEPAGCSKLEVVGPGTTFGPIVRGTDSAAQVTLSTVTVEVDGSARLHEVTSVPGVVYDFDGTRVLYASADLHSIYLRTIGSTPDTLITSSATETYRPTSPCSGPRRPRSPASQRRTSRRSARSSRGSPGRPRGNVSPSSDA
jgi:hypothetical protein